MISKRGTPGQPLTVEANAHRIQDKPNLSAYPGRIDNNKNDTFGQIDPDTSLLHPPTTSVEVY